MSVAQKCMVKSNANTMAKKIELSNMTLLDFKHALSNETRLSKLIINPSDVKCNGVYLDPSVFCLRRNL